MCNRGGGSFPPTNSDSDLTYFKISFNFKIHYFGVAGPRLLMNPSFMDSMYLILLVADLLAVHLSNSTHWGVEL